MRILHYSLGFPPYRSGGLTKFCMDLMKQQMNDGHTITLLWPGQIRLFNKEVSIKDRGNPVINGKSLCIQSFEILNPNPISYDEGINKIESFIYTGPKETYDIFLNEYKPDVIHIHTLMGLHKALLEVAKEKGIRLVFTTHDFFPICPKVTLYQYEKVCTSIYSCENCAECNSSALSYNKIILLQSPMYRFLKDSIFVKKFRKRHRDDFLNGKSQKNGTKSQNSTNDYMKLRDYYYSILKLMDKIHYNSTVTRSIYESVFKLAENSIVELTHSDIQDHRKIKSFSEDYLRIRYLGAQGSGKGYYILKTVLDKMWNNGKKFYLDVHFEPSEMEPYIRTHSRYEYQDLEDIFNNTDILVVPCVWYETFGYTVLEALSYGVPVIISDNVGAKDIIADGAGIIVESNSLNELYDAINNLDTSQLKRMNKTILEKQNIISLTKMAKQIETTFY